MRPTQNAVWIEPHPKPGALWYLHSPVNRHRFIKQEGTEHGHYAVRVRPRPQEFGKRAIMLRDHEMITIDARSMRDHEYLVLVLQRRDLNQFRESPAPPHVRLKNVTT